MFKRICIAIVICATTATFAGLAYAYDAASGDECHPAAAQHQCSPLSTDVAPKTSFGKRQSEFEHDASISTGHAIEIAADFELNPDVPPVHLNF